MRATSAFITSGSSPRMRGKRVTVTGGDTDSRIIPAHAGQTGRLRSIGQLSADHPRACGANGVWGTFNIRGHGSSPRMRGKRSRRRCPTSSPRIIPAHAGQTSCRNCGTHNHPDHPRACGANTIAFGEFFVGSGSSPRMRGKQTGSPDLADSVRIIPAHAGQTTPIVTAWYRTPDHPRACGANTSTRSAYSTLVGSSPRMRGKLVGVVVFPCPKWIIPAHAGQT